MREFQKRFLEEIEHLQLTDRELARLFDLSVPTIKRWKSGESVPHPFAQDVVFEIIRKKAGEKNEEEHQD